MTKTPFGDFLVQKQILTQKQLKDLLLLQKTTNEKIGKILVQKNFLDKQTYLKYLAEYLKVPLVDLTQYIPVAKTTAKLPENYARHFQAILLEESGDELLVGIVDPANIFATDELTRILGKPIKLALVEEEELHHKLDQVYRRTEEITDYAKKLNLELNAPENITTETELKQTDYAVENLISSVFADAEQIGASDVHIEPAEKVLRIRLRVDGVLQEQVISTSEKNIANALSQRLKLMAGLNITERRLPQDGGFSVTVRSTKLDVRLSTMPTIFGESIVMRLLRPTSELLDLSKIGMQPKMLEHFRKLIKYPNGIILVTGPTGSGKTTTLYGVLNEINSPEKKIITVEDPVEYKLERINQVQVNQQIDLTFARVLKSILRQDPNIILVGEIRDKETASIALRAALTGQLVLATLHTNDAASTTIRLIDIGVESYLVAATVRAVLSQRLVRQICNVCRAPHTLLPHEEVFIKTFTGSEKVSNLNFSAGKGCPHCNYTGYQGRTGVYELLELSQEMLEALRRNLTNEFMRLANRDKIVSTTLIENALELAKEGITTISEVSRLAGE